MTISQVRVWPSADADVNLHIIKFLSQSGYVTCPLCFRLHYVLIFFLPRPWYRFLHIITVIDGHRWSKNIDWIDKDNRSTAKKHQLDWWMSEEKNLTSADDLYYWSGVEYFTDDRCYRSEFYFYTIDKNWKIVNLWINTINVKHDRWYQLILLLPILWLAA